MDTEDLEKFGIDVLHQSTSFTVDISTSESGSEILNVLERKGFNVKQERDSVFTIKKNEIRA